MINEQHWGSCWAAGKGAAWVPQKLVAIDLFFCGSVWIEVTTASCEAWGNAELTKSSQSWMSLGDAYVANNGRFLRHGFPRVLLLETLALPLTKHSPPVEERDFILSAAGWRATTDALLSAVLQIWCVFSTMPAWLMTSRSQGKIVGLQLH